MKISVFSKKNKNTKWAEKYLSQATTSGMPYGDKIEKLGLKITEENDGSNIIKLMVSSPKRLAVTVSAKHSNCYTALQTATLRLKRSLVESKNRQLYKNRHLSAEQPPILNKKTEEIGINPLTIVEQESRKDTLIKEIEVVQGIGRKRAQRLVNHLRLQEIKQLKMAALNRFIRLIPGFGEKIENNLLKFAIEYERMPLTKTPA